MANKFVTFLQKVGQDFEKGLTFVLPVAQAAAGVVAVGNPALGAIINTSIGVVLNVEQKFAAMKQQAGTGTQKAAEALTILYPAFEQIFGQYGVKIDSGMVENYIDAIVAALNAFPALPAAPASGGTAAAKANLVVAPGVTVVSAEPTTTAVAG